MPEEAMPEQVMPEQAVPPEPVRDEAAPEPPPFPFPVPDGPDPAAEFGRLRAAGPVARVRLPSGTDAWLVTRYAENREVLAGAAFSRAAAAAAGAPRLRRVPLESGSITTLDPPEHTRLRRIVAGAFTHRRVAALRVRVAAIADELLDGLTAGSRTADLVGGYARPLAMTVICELLGVPRPDQDRFAALSAAYLGGAATPPEETERAAKELRGYLAELVALRRAEPSGDLLGTLVRARDEDRMTETELVALGLTILVAGFETSAGMVAGSVHALLRRDGMLDPRLADRAALRTAVEELLRHVAVSAAGGTIRVATRDVRLGPPGSGVTVRAGEAVLPATTSANRDPAVFAEPDRLDLTRSPNPHLAFGHGPHHCLGASLARVELEEALAALVRRLPALRLAVPDAEVRWRGGGMVRGPERLPIAW
ncbi:cytochrome P450 [Actinomadura rifamycini]|uniref:cytochrome P450 n=1 Tax=Actinomadura rifamycini TaxID=31962 RepID=UPI00040CC795|nr:cytochrome P450 [Actinomadura rifamycini]